MLSKPSEVRFEPEIFGFEPTRVICQKCNKEVITILRYETSDKECMKTCCLLTIGLLFGMICFSQKQELTHCCPNCNKKIGRAIDPRSDLPSNFLHIEPDKYNVVRRSNEKINDLSKRRTIG